MEKTGTVGERRGCRRYIVSDLSGDLIFMNERFPARLTDISLTGCRVETQKRFRAGALQTVELELTYQGNKYQLYGQTEWSKTDQSLGIRFLHPSASTRFALRDLIQKVENQVAGSASASALAKEASAAATPQPSMPATMTTPAPAPSIPAAANPTQPAASGPSKQALPASQLSIEFVRSIHQGAPRALPTQAQDWTADLMLIDSGKRIHTTVLDISLRGCSLRADNAFGEECDSRAQVVMQLDGQRIALPGEPTALETQYILGIKFVDINNDRRMFLNKLILKMRNGR